MEKKDDSEYSTYDEHKDPEKGNLQHFGVEMGGKDVNYAQPRFSNEPVPDRTVLFSVGSAVAYASASLAMVFINKAVLMEYPYTITLLVLQQVTTATLIPAAAFAGLIFVRPMDWATARKLLPLSLLYNANVAFALASLKGVNIPMYVALKRLTPIGVLMAGCFTGSKRPSFQVTLAVVLTGMGVIVAAFGDFTFDLTGYSMGLSSVFFQTVYLLLVEKSGGEKGLSSTELMLYNAVLSLPFLVLYILLTGEVNVSVPLLLAKGAASTSFFTVVTASLFMGVVLNFTMFLCTIVNSALTTTIVGMLKGAVSTVLGFFLLGGVPVTTLNVAGLVINTCGGLWYSAAKYLEKQKRKQQSLPTDEQQPLVQKRPLIKRIRKGRDILIHVLAFCIEEIQYLTRGWKSKL